MPNYLNVFFRSIIESLTEFLPVSSTGHLFLYSSFFPFVELGENTINFDDLFDIFIQTGAIFSVIVLYFSYLWDRLKQAFSYSLGKTKDKGGLNFILSIIVGSFPVMLVGFALKDFLNVIKSREDLLLILGLAWLLGGLVILVVEWKFSHFDYAQCSEPSQHSESSASSLPERSRREQNEREAVSLKKASLIGIFQCIALIPGVSRSAATIITGRMLGLTKKDAAEFSFFLAIPVLIAAGIYKLYKHRAILNSDTLPLLALGSILSFVFCFLIIKWFLAYIKKHSFSLFGYYRVLLGLGVIIFFYR